MIISTQHEYCTSEYAVLVHKNILVYEWHCEGHSLWAVYPNSDLLCPWDMHCSCQVVECSWKAEASWGTLPAGLQAQRKACWSLGRFNLGHKELRSKSTFLTMWFLKRDFFIAFEKWLPLGVQALWNTPNFPSHVSPSCIRHLHKSSLDITLAIQLAEDSF